MNLVNAKLLVKEAGLDVRPPPRRYLPIPVSPSLLPHISKAHSPSGGLGASLASACLPVRGSCSFFICKMQTAWPRVLLMALLCV